MPARNIVYISYFAEKINFGQDTEAINQTSKHSTYVAKLLNHNNLLNKFQL